MDCETHRDLGINAFELTLNHKDGEYTNWTNAFSFCMKAMTLSEPAGYMLMTSSLLVNQKTLVGKRRRRNFEAFISGENGRPTPLHCVVSDISRQVIIQLKWINMTTPENSIKLSSMSQKTCIR